LIGLYLSFIFLYFCLATTSHICLSFFISLINRREVIANADLSSPFDSESDVEMFSIPPLAQQPQQKLQERSSSSLSNSTNRMRSLSTKGISNAPCRRAPLGPFVFTSNGRTGIHSLIYQPCHWSDWYSAACLCPSKRVDWNIGVQ
jgi:hypothetical protein